MQHRNRPLRTNKQELTLSTALRPHARTRYDADVRRPTAAFLGLIAIPLGLLTQHILAIVALVGFGAALLMHAATGFGPKPRFSLAVEAIAVAVLIGIAVGLIGLVAYLIPDV